MATIGEVNKVDDFFIEWKIRNFFSLSKKVNKSYYSPYFSFANISWRLSIEPNRLYGTSEVYIDLFLCRETSGTAVRLCYFLGVKTCDEEIYKECACTYVFKEKEGYGAKKFLKRSIVSEKGNELVPSIVLSVICRIVKVTEAQSIGNTETANCSYCKRSLEAHEDLSSHQKTCIDKPIKCPDCSDVIALMNWYDHKCQTVKGKDHEKLINDFKEMMLSGDHSDVTIMVKGEEFRLHKNVLTARNCYFHAMFKNNMKEKISGIVSIDDCKPDIFRSFINFLYTGKIDKLSLENVCGLYEAATKYQEDQLRENCFHFMVNTMSINNFCDFIVLALRHDDKKLLQEATKLFATKTKEIIRTVKWQNFLLENPIQANELHIKALDFSDDQ